MEPDHDADELINHLRIALRAIQDDDELVAALTQIIDLLTEAMARLEGDNLRHVLVQMQQRIMNPGHARRRAASTTPRDPPGGEDGSAPPDLGAHHQPSSTPPPAPDGEQAPSSNLGRALSDAAAMPPPPTPGRTTRSQASGAHGSPSIHGSQDSPSKGARDSESETPVPSPSPGKAQSYKKGQAAKPRAKDQKRKKATGDESESDDGSDVDGTGPSPHKKRPIGAQRKADPVEELLKDKPVKADQMAEAVRTVLRKYTVLDISRNFRAQHVLRVAAIAIAEANGSITQLRRILDLIAYLLSAQALVSAGELIRNYSNTQPIVASRREQRERAQLAGRPDHGRESMVAMQNPDYDSFIRAMERCMDFTHFMSVGKLLHMEYFTEMYNAYRDLIDSLHDDPRLAQAMQERGERHLNELGYPKKKLPITNATSINALLDMLDENSKGNNNAREQYVRNVNIGAVLDTLLDWGWGALVVLHDYKVMGTFHQINVELLKLAMDAIFNVDKNAVHLFLHLTTHVSRPISNDEPIDFRFSFQKYDKQTMHTSGARHPLLSLMGRDTSGGPSGRPLAPPSSIDGSVFDVPIRGGNRNRALPQGNDDQGSNLDRGSHNDGDSLPSVLAPMDEDDDEDVGEGNESGVRRRRGYGSGDRGSEGGGDSTMEDV